MDKQKDDPVDGARPAVWQLPRVGGSGVFAVLLVALVAWGLVWNSAQPDRKALIAGETNTPIGCNINPDYTWTCFDVATGQEVIWDPFAPENLSIGYAPGGGGVLPSTNVIGGVQTATRTVAGQSAAQAACGTWCMSLTSVGVLGILAGTLDRLLSPADNNMANFKPDPDPGAPYMPTYPCTHITFPGFTAGVTTGSSLQIRGDWYQNGAPSGNSGVLAQCESKSKVVIYSKDAAGLMYRCTSYWTRTFVNPAVNAAYGTLTQTGSWCAPGTRTIVGVVHEPAPNGIATGSNNAEEGPDTVLTLGSFSPGETLFRADVRCESSSGGFVIMSREDIGRVVAKACPPNINYTAGEKVVGTMVTVYSKVIQDDGWSMIDQYETAPAPSPTDTTNYPQCYVNGSNVCKWVVKVDGQACGPGVSQGCFDWTTVRTTEPSRVQCFMGPYVMPVDQCNWLEGAYKGVQYPATIPNIDGNPATWDGVQPTWQPQPTPTATTATVTVTQTATSTSTAPETQTATSSATSTATQTVEDPTATTEPTSTATSTATASPTATSTGGTDTGTGTSGGTAGQPKPGDADGQACWPSGWAAFNPAEWVLQPIKCAFIPSTTATTAQVDTLRTKLGAAGPAPVITALGENFELLSASGCQGPNMPFDLSGVSEDIYPFNACGGTMATVAGYSYALSSVIVIIGGGAASARALASAFGLSLSLGRGGSDGD